MTWYHLCNVGTWIEGQRKTLKICALPSVTYWVNTIFIATSILPCYEAMVLMA
ncbi:MAG: hypothetical protein ACMUEK_03050 [Sodalis sp. (in: enterobacteria)]